MSQSFQCPNCNAPLDYDGGPDYTIQCPYCSSSVIVPESLRPSHAAPQPLLQLGEIGRLAREGKKIDAIKLFRETFGVGLKEAKNAVEALDRGEAVNLPPVVQVETTVVTHPAILEAELRQYLSENKKIEAIKRYREATDSGLKEAKDAVETLERTGSLPIRADAPPPAQEKAAAMAQVTHLAQNGQRDQAVALYRKVMDSSQQEAEGVVQMLAAAADPAPDWVVTQVQHTLAAGRPRPAARAQNPDGSSRAGLWLMLVILLATVCPILFAFTQRGGPLAGVWARVNPFAYARLAQSFGGEGIGAGLFSDPRAIAVDLDGNIFVAEYGEGRIQKFDPTGKFLLLIALPEDSYVSGLTVSGDGILYAAHNGELWQYDAASGAELGSLPNPFNFSYDSVAVTADGELIASTNDGLARLAADGEVVWVVENAISAALDESVSTVHLAVDGLGNIYALAGSAEALLKFSPQGKYLNKWDSEGEEAGQFKVVLAIAVDGFGRIFVSDMGAIEVFDSSLRPMAGFEMPGGVAYGLAVNLQNELLATTSDKQVVKFSVKQP